MRNVCHTQAQHTQSNVEAQLIYFIENVHIPYNCIREREDFKFDFWPQRKKERELIPIFKRHIHTLASDYLKPMWII